MNVLAYLNLKVEHLKSDTSEESKRISKYALNITQRMLLQN